MPSHVCVHVPAGATVAAMIDAWSHDRQYSDTTLKANSINQSSVAPVHVDLSSTTQDHHADEVPTTSDSTDMGKFQSELEATLQKVKTQHKLPSTFDFQTEPLPAAGSVVPTEQDQELSTDKVPDQAPTTQQQAVQEPSVSQKQTQEIPASTQYAQNTGDDAGESVDLWNLVLPCRKLTEYGTAQHRMPNLQSVRQVRRPTARDILLAHGHSQITHPNHPFSS
jgi:hypothetical protein